MVEDIPSSTSQKAEAMVTESVAAVVVKGTADMRAIQPETEVMFIQHIDQAVKYGESNKAIRFVEEVERAGSNIAREALVDAIKKP